MESNTNLIAITVGLAEKPKIVSKKIVFMINVGRKF